MRTTLRPWLGTGAVFLSAIAAFFLLRAVGEAGPHPTAVRALKVIAHGPRSVLASVLLALAVVTLAARGLGKLFGRYLHQPPVVGEIVAGLLLGPSALGALWPEATAFLLPDSVAPSLEIIAKVGVILFMFLVGLELDTHPAHGTAHATITVANASIAVPFVLGVGLSLWLYPLYGTTSVSFTLFSLFIGVSLSVTAFPVLARILGDRGLQRTKLGIFALSCAAVGDVSAWILLAVVVAFAGAALSGLAWTLVLTVLYLLFMWLVVKPWVSRLVAAEEHQDGPLSQGTLGMVGVGLLLSACATEALGIHALFGAFLFGAILPHNSRLAHEVRLRLEDAVVVLFLPAFFAFTGLRTHLGLMEGLGDWAVCGAVVAVATLGKFGGTYLAARAVGLHHREGAALGILMNTRGLMELIVLNLGLDMGVLSPELFAILVVMALATTFATTPVFTWILARGGAGRVRR